MSPAALEFERRIDAPREIVFAYFVDPEKYAEWQGIGAELDPRPGGSFRVRFVSDDGGVAGEYVLIDPPARVVFTWGWEQVRPMPEGMSGVAPGSSTVEVTLVPDGDATIVRVRHSGLPSEEARAIHSSQWPGYLERLAVVLAGGDPGPDPAAVVYARWLAER